jgi:glycosyltransferase involved in cell wall biosynthesis
VAEVVRAHSEHFIQRGHDLTIATTFDAARRHGSQSSQPRVFEFQISGLGNLRHPYRGEIAKYQEFIRNWDGDIILCHCWNSWPTDLAVPMFRSTRVKRVLVSHGFGTHRYPQLVRFPRGLVTWCAWRPYVWRAVRVMRQFDRVVFLSDMVNRIVYYDHWLAKKHRLENNCVIPTGVHADKFMEELPDFRAKFGIGDRRMVLCLSNYDPLKNQLMAVKAFIEAGVPGSVLVVVGKNFNEYTELLRAWCRKAKEENRVMFLEKLDEHLVRAAYRAADLFVCPSLWESGPLVLLEAMAAGTPFVSVDVGFASQLGGGVVVANQAAMTNAIRDLLNDEPLRRKLGQLGRAECARSYNWKTIMPKYDRLLQSLGPPQ